MKTSVTIFLTDILPHKRKLYHKFVKNKIFQNTSVAEGLAALKRVGVTGIELFLPSFKKISDDDIAEVKKVLAQNHMPVLSVHQVLRFLTKTKIEEITRLFQMAEILGAKVIVLHLNSAGRQIFSREYITALHALQKNYGIKIGFENREKYIASYLQPYTWDEKQFADLLGKTDFFITLDTTHLAHSGGNIVNFVKQHKNRVINIHLSDYKPNILNSSLRPLRNKHLPLGKGNLPIKEFLQILKQQQYTGLLTMEIHSDLQGLCESAEMIRKFS